MNKKLLGAEGEQFVCEQLQHQHYFIVDKNWRCRYGELDIIAKKDGRLYIFEVRTKTLYEGVNPQFGFAVEAMHQAKIRKLQQLAQYYCYYKGLTNYDYVLVFAPVSFHKSTQTFQLHELILI